MEIRQTDQWKTSDKELAQELIASGREMTGQFMDGLTVYYVFDNEPELADSVLLVKVNVNEEEGEFSTTDISLVAYLKFRGIHPLRSEWEERSMVWVFEDFPDAVDTVAEFYGCPNDVDVRAYNEQVAAVRQHALTERDSRRAARH